MAEQRLTVAFKVEEAGFLKGIRNAETLARMFDRVNASVNEIGRSVAALALGTGGFGLMLRQITSVNAELQNAQVTIAGLYNTLGNNSWAKSMDAARGSIKRLQKDAAEGVGELSDYLKVYQFVMARAGAHLGRERAYNFTRRAIAAAAVENPETGVKTIGIDINQALTGGLSAQDTPLVNAILRKNNIDAKQFGAMTNPQRIEAIDAALDKYEEAAKAIGRTWSAQLATFNDRIKSLVRAATGVSFASWTEALERVNAWLDRLIPKVERLAHNLGGRTGQAILGGGALAATGLIGGRLALTGAYLARTSSDGFVGWYNNRVNQRNSVILGRQREQEQAEKESQREAARAAREQAKMDRANARNAAVQTALLQRQQAAAQKAEAKRIADFDRPFKAEGYKARQFGPGVQHLPGAFGLPLDAAHLGALGARDLAASPGLAVGPVAYSHPVYGPRRPPQIGTPVPAAFRMPRAAAADSFVYPRLNAFDHGKIGPSTAKDFFAKALGGAPAGVGAGAGTVAAGIGTAGLASGISAAGTAAVVTVAALGTLASVTAAVGAAVFAVNEHLRLNPERWKEVSAATENFSAGLIQAYDSLGRAGDGIRKFLEPLTNLYGGGVLDMALAGLNAFTDGMVAVARTAEYYGTFMAAVSQASTSPVKWTASWPILSGGSDRPFSDEFLAQANAQAKVRVRAGMGSVASAFDLAKNKPLEMELKSLMEWNATPLGRLATMHEQMNAKGYYFSPASYFGREEWGRRRFLNAMPGVTDGDVALNNIPGATINIGQVNVTVKGEVNEDPRRIAVAFGQVLEETHRHSRRARLRSGL